MKYTPIIGLEVHLQLNTKSKMFCSCSNTGETALPNTTICPICTGQPGALPVINKQAVKNVIAAGLALECQIPEQVKFDRKNYFYPDLPKGYQISQYDLPIAINGKITVRLDEDTEKLFRIKRIHLEEDTAKLVHEGNDSLVDYNRSSSPLMELVTEPDMRSAQEARAFCQELQKIFRFLNISDADMEKGHMRCEANISILPEGEEVLDDLSNLGTKVEIKNLNSFRSVEKAIEYETKRQAEVIEKGGKLEQETRGWDEDKQETYSQRIKEEAADYRYFPEPDLPPLRFGYDTDEDGIIDVRKIQATLPELPAKKRDRFMHEHGFDFQTATILADDKHLGGFAENVISELEVWVVQSLKEGTTPLLQEKLSKGVQSSSGSKDIDFDKIKPELIKLVSGWLTSKLMALLKEHEIGIANTRITPENFAEFITIIYLGKINSSAAQKVLNHIFETGQDPSQIIAEQGLEQVDDDEALNEMAKQIIESNPSQVEEYKSGKEALLQYFIGQMMKESKGKANPGKASQIFKDLLK